MVYLRQKKSALLEYLTAKKVSRSRRMAMMLCLLATSSAHVTSTAKASVPQRTAPVSSHKKLRQEPLIGQRSLDPSLKRAVEIAEKDAQPRSTNWCWRYVKLALLESGAVDRYPGTRNAKQAGGELKTFGFEQIPVDDPYKAPVGAVIVYGGAGPGHVEIKTEDGFVSDFKTTKASKRPLQGVWVKFDNRDADKKAFPNLLAMLEDELADATPRSQLPLD